MQGEWNTKQNAKLLFLFPSRSLSWAKPKCARRVKSQTCLSTSELKLPMGEISRSRNPRRQSISQKSARRLEISAVLAEFSKRLVNFCSPQVCFYDKVSGMRGPVVETDGCRSEFFRLETKNPSSPLCMLPLHIKKKRDARSDIPEGHPVNDNGRADE